MPGQLVPLAATGSLPLRHPHQHMGLWHGLAQAAVLHQEPQKLLLSLCWAPAPKTALVPNTCRVRPECLRALCILGLGALPALQVAEVWLGGFRGLGQVRMHVQSLSAAGQRYSLAQPSSWWPWWGPWRTS